MIGPDGNEYDLDLGDGVYMVFTCWKPDRTLNPQYAHLADIEKVGALYLHPAPSKPEGYCMGAITFDSDVARQVFPTHPRWTVDAWDPLSLSPSLLCRSCGHHGFVKNGKWVGA